MFAGLLFIARDFYRSQWEESQEDRSDDGWERRAGHRRWRRQLGTSLVAQETRMPQMHFHIDTRKCISCSKSWSPGANIFLEEVASVFFNPLTLWCGYTLSTQSERDAHQMMLASSAHWAPKFPPIKWQVWVDCFRSQLALTFYRFMALAGWLYIWFWQFSF